MPSLCTQFGFVSRVPFWTMQMLLAVSLAGCATYRPSTLDPNAELKALNTRSMSDFTVEHSKVGRMSTSAPGSGFNPSEGLSEAEVVAVALSLNPDLRAKRLQIGEAQAMLITAGLWPNPEVGVGWKAGIGDSSGYKLDLDVLFELLKGVQRSARMSAVGAQVDEVQAQIVSEEFKTAADVRVQWLGVLAAERSAAFLDQELSLRERLLSLVRQQRSLGEVNELELSAAELEVAQARRESRKAQTELQQQRRELNRQMGLPPELELTLSDSGRPFVITVYEDLSDQELDRRVLSGRPELKTQQVAYRRAEEELRLAILQQYPSLKLGPAFEHELDGSNSLGLGLSMELPIFDRNQGQIAEKQAQRKRLRAEYAATLHRLRSEAYAARAAFRRSKLEVETQEKEILPLVQRSQELSEAAFKARELNTLNWILAQQQSLRARREYFDALVSYRMALIRLETATGLPLARKPAPPVQTRDAQAVVPTP